MATSNFSRGNRTIFVSNYDFDCENIPTFDTNTSVIDSEFIFHDVYIESGYYEGAKIDYRAKDAGDVFDYHLGSAVFNDVDDVEDLMQDLNRYFGELFDFVQESEVEIMLIDEMLLIMEKYDKLPEFFDQDQYNELQIAWENVIEKAIEKAAIVEEQKVNEYLDELRDSYGYSECSLIGTASNGETFYESNKVSKRHKAVDIIEHTLSSESYDDVNRFIYENYFYFDYWGDDLFTSKSIINLFSEFQEENN